MASFQPPRSNGGSTRLSQKEQLPHDREIYFHLKKKQEVNLIEGRNKSWAKKHLTRIDNQHLVYYKLRCSRNSQPNPENSISTATREHVNGILSMLLSDVSKEPSVQGILLQARFGSMYFLLPCHCDKTLSTDELLKRSRRKEFLFGIPFDPQHFVQENTLDVGDRSVRYKVYFVMEGVPAASHMEEQKDGKFKLIWTRAMTRESKTTSWRDKTKLDIVRPGSLVDIRIACVLDRPSCSESSNVAFSQTAEKIAESMKVLNQTEPGSNISIQIIGDNYYVYCVRKKCYVTYKWKENPDWSIVQCQAYTSVNIDEDKCEEMWMKNQQHPIDSVEFGPDPKEEIYFNGTKHPTKPDVDSDTGFARCVTTKEEFLYNFNEFVSTSFYVAEILEDSIQDTEDK